MVLEDLKPTNQNVMLGRRAHKSATSLSIKDSFFPPKKRLKTTENTDGDELSSRCASDEEDGLSVTSRNHSPIRRPARSEIHDSDDDDDNDVESEDNVPPRITELESALPQVNTDKEAIEQYEEMRAEGADLPDDLKSRLVQRTWTRGKSSIYNDAFNLALETVLEDEGHLFDEKELEVFKQWRELDYEAQHL
jgi:Fanconi-associated nuclease 1